MNSRVCTCKSVDFTYVLFYILKSFGCVVFFFHCIYIIMIWYYIDYIFYRGHYFRVINPNHNINIIIILTVHYVLCSTTATQFQNILLCIHLLNMHCLSIRLKKNIKQRLLYDSSRLWYYWGDATIINRSNDSIILNAIEWVNEWLLFSAHEAIIQLYHGENKLIFNEMMMRSALY